MAVLVGLAVAGAGCGQQESIARYSVPKETQTPVAPREEAASNPTAWFFKLQGPAESVSKVEDQFTEMVESVRFTGGKPTWTLPEGWSESGAQQMRFATLSIDGSEPPLEVSVIPLPVFGNDINEYVRQNIDRWRGQIGLERTAGTDWLAAAKAGGEVHESKAADMPVTFVDLRGRTEEIAQARMLGAILLPDQGTQSSSQPAARPPAAASRAEPRASSPLTYESPEGWEEGKASSMRAASFAVSEGGRQVDISAIVAGGNELDNVNRWRQQIGLAAVSSEELDRTARELQVDGSTGRMFELVGEKETILAVIVPQGGQSWFFKLMGDPALAEREKSNFESFVTSVQFP